jgi:hypothetical protein
MLIGCLQYWCGWTLGNSFDMLVSDIPDTNLFISDDCFYCVHHGVIEDVS